MRNKTLEAKQIRASIVKFVKQYWVDTSGATAIEYGLLSALIGVVLISGASALGGNINERFIEISLLLSGPLERPSTNGL